MEKTAAAVFLAFTIVMIILYGVFTEYAPPSATQGRYIFFQDVHVMIFIGFGFLMTFMRRGGFTATSHAMAVAAYCATWAILNRGFWHRVIKEDAEWNTITLTVTDLVGGDFCAGAVLISFGAVLGRVTATQLMLMGLIEVIFFSINEMILIDRLFVADIGGSMVIHTFGAYFGLAVSFVLEKADPARKDKDSSAHGATRVTDTMAMIGTLFLFCFWPSFNGALAGTTSQDRCIINTVMSMFMSCVGAFFMCCLVDAKGKIGMVEMQNSTIAGGVAIGAAADMVVNPYGAMLVGLVAGCLSVIGYRFLTIPLERKIGLRDTCGVHNLHGMPGILGAIVAVIAAGAADKSSYMGTYGDVFSKSDRSHSKQAWHQFAALWVTLGFAIIPGAITGFIISRLPSLTAFFEDAYEYVMPDVHAAERLDKELDEHRADLRAEQTFMPNVPEEGGSLEPFGSK